MTNISYNKKGPNTNSHPVMTADTRRRLALFGGFTLVFLAALAILYHREQNDAILIVCMFSPSLSAVLTRLLTKEGIKDLFLAPHFRGNLRWYAFAWLAMPLIAYAGAVLYFVLFPGTFDPLGSIYAKHLGAQSLSGYLGQVALMLPLAVLVNPFGGILQCLGEEFAWRGYLLPKLSERFTPLQATLLTGVLWGVWHSPFIAMGYNYGSEHPAAGILAMIVFCTALGCVQGWIFFRVRSVWPAALLHAAINGLDLCAPSELFMSRPANMFVGPDLIGLIGGAGILAAAIVCAVLLARRQPVRNT